MNLYFELVCLLLITRVALYSNRRITCLFTKTIVNKQTNNSQVPVQFTLDSSGQTHPSGQGASWLFTAVARKHNAAIIFTAQDIDDASFISSLDGR